MGLPRFAAVAIGGAVVLGVVASPVRAESALWTLVATPLTSSTGSPTNFSLTATNEDPLALLSNDAEIGCVRVTLPDIFEVQGAAVVSSTTGPTWSASITGRTVTVRTMNGGDRLALLDAVRFTITALPLSAGELAWSATAHRDLGCGGAGALLGIPPVVLVTGPSVTPTPAPTLTPSPTPVPVPSGPASTPRPRTSVPTPTPAALATQPPTVSPPSSLPGAPGPSASAGPSERAGAARTPTPRATERPDGAAGDDPTAGTIEVDSGSPPNVPGGAARAEAIPVSLGPLGLLGTIDVWIVPGLIYGVPGVLLLLFVIAQALGAAAWIPAIRRLRGDGETPPRIA